MKNEKLKRKWGGMLGMLLAGAMLFILANSAQASLTLTPGTIKDHSGAVMNNSGLLTNIRNGQRVIDVYNNDPSGLDPQNNVMAKITLAKDEVTYTTNPGVGNPPNYALDYSKFLGYVTSDDKLFFVRGADENAPGGKVWVRVWEGNYYSKPEMYDNGALAGVSGTLNTIAEYKADKPYSPVISRFEENLLQPVGGSGVSYLKIYSDQPMGNGGKREVTDYKWFMWKDGDKEPAKPLENAAGVIASDALTLDSTKYAKGQKYWFKVVHSNWFGDASMDKAVDYTPTGTESKKIIGSVSNIKASLLQENKVKIAWVVSGVSDAQVERSVDGGKTWQVAAGPLTATSWEGDADNAANPLPKLIMYKIRAVGGFAAETVVGKMTLDLSGGAGKLGVNTFILPFKNIISPDISTAQKLVEKLTELNKGDPVVTVFGYWDAEKKSFVGGKIKYEEGVLSYVSSEKLKAIKELELNRPYQISVSNPVKIVILGEI